MGIEKRFTGPARLASWAPNMDVIALVSAEGQLSAFRFNWQRQWTHTCEENVTSLCWRPDGKLIVAGLADGSLSFHDAENGELVLLRKSVHASPVNVLDWRVDAAVAAPRLRLAEASSRWSDSNCFPRSDAAASTTSTVARLMDTDDAERLDVLVSVDQGGACLLSAFGVFPVARFDLRAMLSAAPNERTATATMRAVGVEMAADFSHLRLLLSGAQSDRGDVVYARVATTMLRTAAPELRSLARGGYRVQLLLDSISSAVTSCARQLGDTNSAFGDKLTAFSTLLRDHGSEATASEELMSLLITGVASAATNQFLSTTLGIGGLKRLAKAVDTAFATVHSLLTDQLRPAIECLLLRMNELLGLAMCSERSATTGLRLEGCEQSIVLAEGMLAAVAQAVIACRDAGCAFRHCFLWMQRCQKRLNDDGNSQFDVSKVPFVDMDSVAAFVQGGMRADSLEALVMPTAPNSLGALARALQECCSGIFGAIPLAVSATCACTLRHAILSRGGGADTSRLAAYGPSEYACFLAYDESSGAGGELGILRHAISASADAGLEAVLLRFAAGERIVDAQFYRDARLLVLLCDRTGAARLDLVACDQLEYAAVGDADTIAADCRSAGAVMEVARTDAVSAGVVPLSMANASAPLAVSSKRGLACAFCETTRGLLIDLEAGEDE